MANAPKTVIVTGGSQGIGSGAVKTFLDRTYNVVATSRNVTKSTALPSSPKLALVDGDIGDASTAARVAETAISTFGSIDALVNNAGIFFTKPFTDYTAEDFKRLVSTNLDGFIYITQLAIKQMLAQKSGGSIVSITASLADNPIAGVNASIPMITKGGAPLDSKSKCNRLSEPDLHVFAKLFEDRLERGLEAQAFSGREIGGDDDVLDFFVGHLVDVDLTRQPAA